MMRGRRLQLQSLFRLSLAQFPLARSLLARLCANDFQFDDDVIRTANHQKMLDVVASDDHKLALAVEVNCVDYAKPRQPGAAVARRLQPAPGGKAENDQDERRSNQRGDRRRGKRQTLILEDRVNKGLHQLSSLANIKDGNLYRVSFERARAPKDLAAC